MIDFQDTKNTNAFYEAYRSKDYNYLVLEGGTSSSKTFSAIFFYILLASNVPNFGLTSFVAESVPKLKVGMMRDFVNIMAGSFTTKKWNATDRVYTFANGNKIEFLNADDENKVKGPRRGHCLIDEANHLSYNIARHIFVRTKGFKVVTHNPTSEYWAHEQLQPRDDCMWVHSTFLDALHVLDESTVREIIAQKDKDPNWWRVYGEGLIGKIEGLVHPNFTQVDALPEGQPFYGLDFGWSDPMALVKNVAIEDKLYSDELVYQSHMPVRELIKVMSQHGVRKHYDVIYCDSARPDYISELHNAGYNAKKAPKGITHGINKVNTFRQHWTKRSINGIKEQRNWKFITDKDGNITEKPVDAGNHLMDARQYAVTGKYLSRGKAVGRKIYL